MSAVKQFQVTFDCVEPERVARSWAEVLGYVVPPDAPVVCMDPTGVGPPGRV